MHIRPPNKNRNNRNKSGRKPTGNVQNRVYESAGPEGKVRGTPQQIIEKYMLLARDAQTSGDRVTAENFLQHAEHYIRLLNASQVPGEERRPLPAFGMQSRADYDDVEDQEEDAAAEAAEASGEDRRGEERRGEEHRGEERRGEARNGEARQGEQRDRDWGRGDRRERGERRADDRRPEDRRSDERRAEERRPSERRNDDAGPAAGVAEPEPFVAVDGSAAGLETIDAGAEEGGLVATPESREPEPEAREPASRRRRRRPAAAAEEAAAVAETAAEG